MSTLPTLRRGDTGSAVKYLQERLSAKGFTLKVDGIFGPTTDKVVRQFQASCNIKVDGIVGSMTWGYLQQVGEVASPADLLEEQRQWLKNQIPASVSGVRRRVLESACGDLGLKEIPDGSNYGDEIFHLVGNYNDYWKVSTARYGRMAWCAMACSSWIAFGFGLKPNPNWGDWKGHPFYTGSGGAWLGGVSQMEKWAKDNGRWHAPSAKASTEFPSGALFTVSRGASSSDPALSTGAGHVGMVVCDNGDGTITTIEGNVSNKVGSHRRRKTSLRGYFTWW